MTRTGRRPQRPTPTVTQSANVPPDSVCHTLADDEVTRCMRKAKRGAGKPPTFRCVVHDKEYRRLTKAYHALKSKRARLMGGIDTIPGKAEILKYTDYDICLDKLDSTRCYVETLREERAIREIHHKRFFLNIDEGHRKRLEVLEKKIIAGTECVKAIEARSVKLKSTHSQYSASPAALSRPASNRPRKSSSPTVDAEAYDSPTKTSWAPSAHTESDWTPTESHRPHSHSAKTYHVLPTPQHVASIPGRQRSSPTVDAETYVPPTRLSRATYIYTESDWTPPSSTRSNSLHSQNAKPDRTLPTPLHMASKLRQRSSPTITSPAKVPWETSVPSSQNWEFISSPAESPALAGDRELEDFDRLEESQRPTSLWSIWTLFRRGFGMVLSFKSLMTSAIIVYYLRRRRLPKYKDVPVVGFWPQIYKMFHS